MSLVASDNARVFTDSLERPSGVPRSLWGPARVSPWIERLAHTLDSSFRVPVVGWRFGLDGVIGLVPVVGDVLSAVYGAALLFEGLRLRMPWTTISKMAGNLIMDALLGSVPVIGDALDFVYKPNERNLRLLQARVGGAPAVGGEESHVSTE